MINIRSLFVGIGDVSPEFAEIAIKSVTSDSRQVSKNDVFVAIKGTGFDGNSKVGEAIMKGAVGIVTEHPIDKLVELNAKLTNEMLAKVHVAKVPNSRKALAELVVRHITADHDWLSEMNIFGVTGTNGKTTVAVLMYQILEHNKIPCGFIGTTGIIANGKVTEATHTTPHPVALFNMLHEMHQAGIRHVCMEVSSHALHQYRTFGIPFKGAFFTNLSRDHIDYHGSMEEYARAKKLLFDWLTPDAIAVFHGLSEWPAYMRRHCIAKNVINVGERAHNNVRITNIVTSAAGSSYTLHLPTGAVDIRSPMIGRFNVFNTALCAVMAVTFGLPVANVVEALSVAKGPVGRMERHELPNGAIAVVDYAHSPDALQNALSVLRELLPKGGLLHLVFGCGGNRDRGKRGEMGRIAGRMADAIILTNDNPRDEDPNIIIQNITAGIDVVGKPILEILDRKEAIITALRGASEKDVILIAGKGHETVQVVRDKRIEFSDAEVVRGFES